MADMTPNHPVIQQVTMNSRKNTADIVTNVASITAIELKTDFISVTQAVDLDTMESDIATNNAKVTYPGADSTKVGYISVTSDVNLNTMASQITTLEETVVALTARIVALEAFHA